MYTRAFSPSAQYIPGRKSKQHSLQGQEFSRLYGFTPMKLPEGFAFTRLIHVADERIPVEALRFGVGAMREVFRRLG